MKYRSPSLGIGAPATAEAAPELAELCSAPANRLWKPAAVGQITPLSGKSNGIRGKETSDSAMKLTPTLNDKPRRNSAEGHVLSSEIAGLSVTLVSTPGVIVTSFSMKPLP